MVQWLARLPGTQEIRGSSPGRGMTDFCTSIFICLYIYIYTLEFNTIITVSVMMKTVSVVRRMTL